MSLTFTDVNYHTPCYTHAAFVMQTQSVLRLNQTEQTFSSPHLEIMCFFALSFSHCVMTFSVTKHSEDLEHAQHQYDTFLLL